MNESDKRTLMMIIIIVSVISYGMVQVKDFAEGLRDKVCNESTIMCNEKE